MMNEVELKTTPNRFKFGQQCPSIQANIIDDSIFYLNGEPIGFFLKNLTGNSSRLMELANKEFLSERVPKTKMTRATSLDSRANGLTEGIVEQLSTIIGSVPPNTRMRRPYPSKSSVHRSKTAMNFIKSMYLAAEEVENVIKEILPAQYFRQKEVLKNVSEEWRIGNLFTSSISNFNIPAAFHVDRRNIKNTVNAIITKRSGADGGNLHVPEYNLTIAQCDNSLLVYPAWRNMHGVTPIAPKVKGGYRNSFIFYPLKAFLDSEDGQS